MGHLSIHMAQHLLVMNLLVPVAVYFVSRRVALGQFWHLWPYATAAQIVLIWAWHAPIAFEAATGDAGMMALMHASLALAAAWFWASIAGMPGRERWQAALALLITGKLFCLLGALLVFAPNLLFGPQIHHAATDPLGDQQMAGMIMLVACPLSYVAAGIVVAGRWFLSLEGDEGAHA